MDVCDTRCTGWLGGVLHRINNIKPYKCNNKRSALLTISRYCIVSTSPHSWWVFRCIKYTIMVCKLFYLKKKITDCCVLIEGRTKDLKHLWNPEICQKILQQELKKFLYQKENSKIHKKQGLTFPWSDNIAG